MSHDWQPREWREMDGMAVLRCLKENDRRVCVDGQEWIRLIPDAVLADALCILDVDICYEAARRIDPEGFKAQGGK